MSAPLEQQCGCSDCEAAVSPAAYLVDLLDYTLKHVRNNKAKIDLQFLVDKFHQPFIDLPTDCAAVDEQLRQVRICIEVLRSHLGTRPLADAAKEAALAQAEADYRFAAYVLLLSRLGTSYEEIRRVRAETAGNRTAVADRLGVDLAEPRSNDALDQLFFVSSIPPQPNHALTEQAIERLFGLADTARDPLSKGAKFEDEKNQITRWNLYGVAWGMNTDPDGAVHVVLQNPAPGVFRVELHQDRLRTKLLASGEIATAAGTVKLIPELGSHLSGIFDIAYTADSSVISIAALPAFTSWQSAHLRTLWLRQDHPVDAYEDDAVPRLPVIDPDLIGPDDFRRPAPKGTPTDPDKAFDLWLARRKFVDTTLAGLKAAREAKGIVEILQQALGNPLPDVDALLLTLTKGGAPGGIKAANDSVKGLGLSIESFARSMAIRAKDRLAQSDARNEPVTDLEWSELYSVLAQALKSRQYDTWRTAEKNSDVAMGLEEFWFSVTEPKEGDWPAPSRAGEPYIDPDIVKITELPDWLAGTQAVNLWNQRRARIEQIPKDLQAQRETNGFVAMLRLALGNPAPGNLLQHDPTALSKDLGSADDKVRGAAANSIVTDFHLTVESFGRLMEIKAANDQSDPAKKPTAAEWAELYAILTPARKVKHEYPAWAQQEKASNIPYWGALKAKLPRWRASADSRQAWLQALRVRSRPAIVDATMMGADDLRNIVPGDPAFDLWKRRRDHLDAVTGGLKTTRQADDPDALKGLDQIIADALGFDPSILMSLDLDRRAGHSIDKRLEQLNLIDGGFTYLMRIRALAVAKQPIIEAEWETVYATLARGRIQREFAAFHAEERDSHIILAPDSFKIAEALSTPLPFLDALTPRWLSTWQARRDWQDALQSRIDQQASLAESLRNAVSAIEEATLPALRDSLIEASDAAGANRGERAESITARLLIDARSGACHTTTRVAQALETLQSLVFDLRTGELKQPLPPPLTLISDSFDEEWKWIGSYAPWRSAMFVSLYPENILQPSLLKDRSPAFDALIQNTRGLQIGSAVACHEAERYASYFQDVCSLEIEATCQASTLVDTGRGCDHQTTNARSMFYMFARAASGKMYWSAYNAGGNVPAPAQTFWKEVNREINAPEGIRITRIVGAMPYRASFSVQGLRGIDGGPARTILSSFIHLFFISGEPGKQILQLARLSLDEFGKWDGALHPLTPPPPMAFDSTLEIVPVQTQSEFTRPGIVFHTNDSTKFYFRTLGFEGTAWEPSSTEWAAFLNVITPANSLRPDSNWKEIKAAASVNGDMWFVARDHMANYLAQAFSVKGGGQPIVRMAGIEGIGDAILGLVPGPQRGPVEITSNPIDSDIYVLVRNLHPGATEYLHVTNPWVRDRPANGALSDLIRIPPNSGAGVVGQKMIAYERAKNGNAFYMYKVLESGDALLGLATIRALPRVRAPLSLSLHQSAESLRQRRVDIIDAFGRNADATTSVLAYLREAYYFVPMQLALALQSSSQYLAALDCFRTVYDYEAPIGSPNQRNIYYGLELDSKLPDVPLYQQANDWLLDPLNPHSIAATRRNSYTRFTIMSIVRCLLDYADSEFAQDTGESLSRARTDYIVALDLLSLAELQQKFGACDDVIAELKIEPGKDIPPEVPAAVNALMEDLTRVPGTLRRALKAARDAKAKLTGSSPWTTKLAEARAVVMQAAASAPLPSRTGGAVSSRLEVLKEQHAKLLTQTIVDNTLQDAARAVANDFAASR